MNPIETPLTSHNLIKILEISEERACGIALCEAICSEDTEKALQLIESGVNIEEMAAVGRRWAKKAPIHYACEKCNLTILKALLEKKAHRHALDELRSTPLIELYYANYAYSRERTECIELLTSSPTFYADEIKAGGGIISLCHAIDTGDTKRALKLIDAGADIEGRWDEKAPIHYACQKGDLAIIKALLEKGAERHVVNDTGWSPLGLLLCQATSKEKEECLELLTSPLTFYADEVKAEGFITSLRKAIGVGDTKIALKLIEAGADVDRKWYGEAPIHTACRQGNFAIIKSLLEKRALPNAFNRDGLTPLRIACSKKDKAIVKLLLQDGRLEPELLDYENILLLNDVEILKSFLAHQNIDLLNKYNRKRFLSSAIMYEPLANIEMVFGSLFLQMPKSFIPQGLEVGILAEVSSCFGRRIEKEVKEKEAIESFLTQLSCDPETTARKMAIKHFLQERAADWFSSMILCSDDFLELQENNAEDLTEAKRFFTIAGGLPMELQMVLSRRAAGLSGDVIPSSQIDPALKRILTKLSS
jgi:ankyrin repeat protein